MAFTVSTESSGSGTSTDTFTGPVPGTITEGDLIIASLIVANPSSDAYTLPDGTWSAEIDDGAGNLGEVGTAIGYLVASHQVTAAEEASPPASWDIVLDTARVGNVEITHVTGHDASDPFDTAFSSATGSFSDTVSLDCPGLTSTIDDALLLGGCAVNSASSRTITEPTSPGAWTEDDSTCTLGWGKGQDAAHYVLGSAGATGDVPWYQSGSSLSGFVWQVVIAPAVGGEVTAVTGSGGALVGGAATVEFGAAVTGSGGMLAGGAGAVEASTVVTGSGGVLVGGGAGLLAAVVAPAAGGVLVSGAADVVANPKAAVTGSGGVLVGGAAVVNANPKAAVTGSGGVVVGGDGAATVAVIPSVTGGVVVGGAATVAAGYTVTGSGGIVLGGAADYTTPDELFSHVATGGILTSGGGTSATSSPRTAYAVGHRYWTFRYELLDLDNEFVTDLDNVLTGKVSMSWLAPIRRKAEFTLVESDVDINWLTDRIKPWVRLHLPPYGTDDWVEWPLGVFLLSSPTRAVDASGVVVRHVTGYDQLQVLDDDKIGDRYTIAAGATHTDEVLTLLGGDFAYRLTARASTTRVAREWPPGTSKLSMVNDLLGAINYSALYFDEDGVAVIAPYVSPAVRTEEYTYADDETSLVMPDVEQELDLFSVANKWVLVVSNPDADLLVSTYTNDNPASPTSTVRRGRTITDYREEEEADSQADLDAKAERLALSASQIYEHVRFTTGINPLHSGNDVYRIALSGLAVNSKFSETKWEMELRAGADMTHEARRLVSI